MRANRLEEGIGASSNPSARRSSSPSRLAIPTMSRARPSRSWAVPGSTAHRGGPGGRQGGRSGRRPARRAGAPARSREGRGPVVRDRVLELSSHGGCGAGPRARCRGPGDRRSRRRAARSRHGAASQPSPQVLQPEGDGPDPGGIPAGFGVGPRTHQQPSGAVGLAALARASASATSRSTRAGSGRTMPAWVSASRARVRWPAARRTPSAHGPLAAAASAHFKMPSAAPAGTGAA